MKKIKKERMIKMKKLIMQLGGVACPTCLTKIEGAMKQEAGVENAKVMFNSGKLKADFDESQNSTEHLTEVLEKLGYDVLSVKVK